MSEKATWGPEELKLFCELCATEVFAGHRPLGHLNKVGWKNVEDKFAEKSGKKRKHLQFKNKWDGLKRGYSCFMELKNLATGLGWNEAKQTVDCDEKWWEEHMAKCHDPTNGRECKHVQFKHRGPPNLDLLHIMYGSAHVTGASALLPGDTSSNSNDDDVQELDKNTADTKLPTLQNKKDKKRKKASSACMEEKEEKSPFLRIYKQTCSKIEEGVNKITSSVEASSAPAMSNQVPTIRDSMKMLKDCGVEEGTALMHTATLLIIKPEIRELLNSFETKEGSTYHLVDSGYPNRTGYLAPYKGSTYHLPEFRLRRQRAPRGKYEMFNYLHSSLRNVIERSFGVLKQKWRILKSMPSFSTRRQAQIIIACMALHNFIRDSALRDDDFEKCDENEDYVPTDEDEDNDDEDIDEEQAVYIQDDDIVPEEENELSMNTIRDNIANALIS